MATTTLMAIPFACSLAAHVALEEAGASYRVTWVRRRTGRADVDTALADINPKGKVAALVLEDGSVVTENVAVLLCIAERSRAFAIPSSAPLRWRLYEQLSFVATEIHKQVLAPWFDPETPEAARPGTAARLPDLLRHPESVLSRTPFLLGEAFSVADAYLFWALLLVPQLGLDLDAFPALAGFRRRLMKREAVASVLTLERRALANQGASP